MYALIQYRRRISISLRTMKGYSRWCVIDFHCHRLFVYIWYIYSHIKILARNFDLRTKHWRCSYAKYDISQRVMLKFFNRIVTSTESRWKGFWFVIILTLEIWQYATRDCKVFHWKYDYLLRIQLYLHNVIYIILC